MYLHRVSIVSIAEERRVDTVTGTIQPSTTPFPYSILTKLSPRSLDAPLFIVFILSAYIHPFVLWPLLPFLLISDRLL
jgi:hypothetical protein